MLQTLSTRHDPTKQAAKTENGWLVPQHEADINTSCCVSPQPDASRGHTQQVYSSNSTLLYRRVSSNLTRSDQTGNSPRNQRANHRRVPNRRTVEIPTDDSLSPLSVCRVPILRTRTSLRTADKEHKKNTGWEQCCQLKLPKLPVCNFCRNSLCFLTCWDNHS